LVLNANPAPGILKKDLKQPCYRYFMEKLCPDFKAGKCKFDHSADAMKILFSKIKNHWSNFGLPNRLHSLEDIPFEAPNDDVEESESFDYSCLHHPSEGPEDSTKEAPNVFAAPTAVRFETLNMLRGVDRLNALLEIRDTRSPIVSAKILFLEDSFYFGRCLLDTGASGRNYITQSALDKLVRSFGSDVLVEDCSAGVILGDARTHLLIDKKVTLTLIMPADAVNGPVVTLDFLVFSIDYDLVIGISDIIDHFLPLLWDALGTKVKLVFKGKKDKIK
jgi:hypothetical protein